MRNTLLVLFRTRILDFSPLKGLKKLEKIFLLGCKVDDAELATLKKSLPNLKILR